MGDPTHSKYDDYRCPGCDEPLTIRTARHRRQLDNGGKVFHNRECQKAASSETRPCAACGKPITRRKSEFADGPAACNPVCRAALKKNAQPYQCANGCGRTVWRTPANVHNAVYCSRECSAQGRRAEGVFTATCAGCDTEFEIRETARIQRAQQGKPVYHNRACQMAHTRVKLACASCGSDVWRYRSQMTKRPKGRPVRVFCDPCIKDGKDPRKPRTGTTKPCGVCGKPVYRRPVEDHEGPRYCSPAHRAQAMRGPRVERPERPCEVCGTVMRLEPDQVRQNVRTCSPECTGKLRRRKPGERYIDPSGYAIITAPDGRSMPEHRYKMEQLLADVLDGGPLPKGVNVHHINGVKDDNTVDGPLVMGPNGYWRSGNLELWVTHQPSGQRLADLIRQAENRELEQYRSRYGPLATDQAAADLRAAGYRPVGELLEEAAAILAEHGTGEARERLLAILREHDGSTEPPA